MKFAAIAVGIGIDTAFSRQAMPMVVTELAEVRATPMQMKYV